MHNPTPPVHRTTEPQDMKRTTPKRVLIIILSLLAIASAILGLLLFFLPKPAPVKPAPKPATPTVEEPALIEELITLRQNFVEAPRFACLSPDGEIKLTDDAVSRDEIYTPLTKKVDLATGGERISWGQAECMLYITPTETNIAKYTTLIQEAGKQVGADEYADLSAAGMYQIQAVTGSAADQPYSGIDAVALTSLRAKDGVGSHQDPVGVTPATEVLELLRAASMSSDESLRDMEVTDENIAAVLELLRDVKIK